MALNYPGPYELRSKYQVGSFDHEFRLSLALDTAPAAGDNFNTITPTVRVGPAPTLDIWVDGLLAVLAPAYNPATTTFGITELWKYTPNTNLATFITSYASAQLPTAVGADLPANQVTFTFRTIEGGIMRLQLMESGFNIQNQQKAYPTGTVALDDIFEYISGVDSPVLGRDTSYAFAPLRVSQGENEALWRKHYR